MQRRIVLPGLVFIALFFQSISVQSAEASSPYPNQTESVSLLPFTCDELLEEGRIQVVNNQYLEALKTHHEALDCYKNAGDENSFADLGEIDSLLSIGEIYAILGQNEKALEIYREVQILVEEKQYVPAENDPDYYIVSIPDQIAKFDYVIILNRVEKLLVSTGNYQDAISHFEFAIGELNKIGTNYWNEADRYNIGASYYVITKSLEAELYSGVGNAYYMLGQYRDAIQFSQQSLDIWAELEQLVISTDKSRSMWNTDAVLYTSLSGQGSALQVIGSSNIALYKYDTAVDDLGKARLVWERTGNNIGIGSCLYLMGIASRNAGDVKAALDYYRDAVEHIENTQNTLSVDEFQISYAEQYNFVYEEIIDLLAKEGNYEDAFNYVERARARAFLNQFARKSVTFRSNVDSSLLDEERTLRQRIANLRVELLSLKTKPNDGQSQSAITKTSQDLNNLLNEYADLLTMIKLKNPQLAQFVGVDVASIGEIQSDISQNITLVEYFLLNDRVLIFIITNADFNAVSVELNKEELIQTIGDFRNFTNINEPYPESLKRLYDWLILPIYSHLATPGLIIIPHNELNYLPFAALTNGETYLVDEFVISTLPSASVLRFISGKKANKEKNILALGNPAVDLPPLSFAEKEVKAITNIFGTTPLIGQAATESVVRDESNKFNILHLAAHGEYYPGNPLFSAIYLSPDDKNDGRLEVHEIYDLDLGESMDLVVLSACQSSIGQLSKGDDIIGLTRAFMFAGSPTVIASLWNVDDQSTSLLMERFYNNLSSGQSKASALRFAQLETRKKYPNPYYWAPFVLTGDAGDIQSASSSPSIFRPSVCNNISLLIFFLFGILVRTKPRWRI